MIIGKFSLPRAGPIRKAPGEQWSNEKTCVTLAVMRTVWVLCVGPVLAYGQVLSLSSATVSPNGQGSILLSFHASKRHPATGLQFELIYSPGPLQITADDLVAGSAAFSSGKAVNCIQPPKQKSYRCMVAGGSKPIPDGPVVIINFRVRGGTDSGTATVQIRSPIGVSPRLEKIELQGTEASISAGNPH